MNAILRGTIIFCTFFFLFSSCRKSNDLNEGWNTTLLTPLIKSTLDLSSLVNDTLLQSETDSSLRIVYSQNLYGFSPADRTFKIPDTTIKASYSVVNLELADQSIVYPISLGELCHQLIQSGGVNAFIGNAIIEANSTYSPIPSFPPISSGDNDIDATKFFKTATLKSGFIDMKIDNGFPIPIDKLVFQIKNKVSKEIISTQTFLNILPHTSQTKQIDLSGKTMEGQLVATIVNLESSGSGSSSVLIDTSNALTATMQAHDLIVESATAVFPSQNLIDQNNETTYVLSGGAKLNLLKIKSGKMVVTIRSSIADTSKFDYSLPGAIDANGKPMFAKTVLPPAPPNGVTVSNRSYDLSGYTLSLKGISGNLYNTFVSHVTARIDSTGREVSLSTSDSVYIDYGLVDIVPDYTEGYLGQQIVTVGPDEQSFDLFKKIKSGSLALEKVSVDLGIENGVGADGRIILYDLSSVNSSRNSTVTLTGSSIVNQPLSIVRATDFPLAPSVTNFHLDNTNSNIKSLIENLPDKLKYKLDVFINPSGNSHNYSDFAYYNSPLNVSLDLSVPLSLIANKLMFADTVDFNLGSTNSNGSSSIKNGIFNLIAENGFPLKANMQVFLYDDYGVLIDSLMAAPHEIAAGILDNNCHVSTVSKSVIQIPVDDNKMNRIRNAKKAVVLAVLNTSGNNNCNSYQKIYSNYKMEVKLTGKFTYYTGR